MPSINGYNGLKTGSVNNLTWFTDESHFPTQSSYFVILGIRDKSPPNTHTHTHTVLGIMNHLSGWWASLKHPLSSLATHPLPFLSITLKRQGDPLHSPSWNKNSGGTAGKMWWAYRPSRFREARTILYCGSKYFLFSEIVESLKSYKYIFKQLIIIVKKRVFPQGLQILINNPK